MFGFHLCRRLTPALVIGATAWVMSGAITFAFAQTCDRSIYDTVGAMPGNMGFIMAGRDLGLVKDHASVSASLRFVKEYDLFQNSFKAWETLGAAFDQTSDETFEQLLGRFAVLGVLSGTEGDQSALLSVVTPQVEQRVRRVLSPVPRSLQDGSTRLAVEEGAFLLLTRHDLDETGDCASVLVAPRGSEKAFESLSSFATDAPVVDPMRTRSFWTELQTLAEGELFVLSTVAESRDDFVAAGITFESDSIRAELLGTPELLLHQMGKTQSPGVWPRAAAELLEVDAELFVIGQTGGQSDATLMSAPSPATLLERSLSALSMPPELAAKVSGIAIFAVHMDDDGESLLLVGAVPAEDIDAFAIQADAHASWFARDSQAAVSPQLPHDSIRVLALSRPESLVAGRKSDAAIAWRFVRLSSGTGWWVITLASSPKADQDAIQMVERLSDSLEETPIQAKGNHSQIFGLSVQPNRLSTIGRNEAEGTSPMRWIRSIKSTLFQDRPDRVRGEVNVTLDGTLLTP